MTRLATQELIIDVPGRRSGTALNLTIEPGQVWGVLGPNGAGKTTLLHTLAGLHAPRSGQVLLGDTPLGQLRRRQVAQRLGLVFQERLDGFPATVLESALIGRHPYLSLWQREGAYDYARAEAALAALLAATAYLWMSGGGVATERAFVMVAAMLGAILADRRAISLRTVALAGTLILAMNPQALLSPGFQMSFAATVALILTAGPWARVSLRLPWRNASRCCRAKGVGNADGGNRSTGIDAAIACRAACTLPPLPSGGDRK